MRTDNAQHPIAHLLVLLSAIRRSVPSLSHLVNAAAAASASIADTY